MSVTTASVSAGAFNISSAYCPVLTPPLLPAEAIRLYKKWGLPAYAPLSTFHIAAGKLGDCPEGMRHDYYSYSSYKMSDCEKKKAVLLQKAFDDYLTQANNPTIHPFDKAIRLRQSRDVLETITRRLTRPSPSVGDLHFKEALACEEAASIARDPIDKISWALQGVDQLDISQLRGRYPTSSLLIQKARLGASLLEQAGDLLSQFSSFQIIDYSNFPLLREGREVLSPQGAAAKCYRQAGLLLDFVERGKGISLSIKSIEAQRTVDLSLRELAEQAQFRAEIADTCLSLFSHSDEQIGSLVSILRNLCFEEAMKTQELYGLMAQDAETEPKVHYLIQKARYLAAAAAHNTSFPRTAELYSMARDAAQAAWNLDPEVCLGIQDFTLQPAGQLIIRDEASLLSRLKEIAASYEQQQKQQQEQPSWLSQILRFFLGAK